MRTAPTTTLLASVIVLASGCATPRLDRSFERVAAAAGERLGATPAWPTDAEGRDAIDERVRALVAEPITEERAVAIALINNRGLRAEYARLGSAEAERVEAGMLENPGFTAGAGFPDRPPSITALDFGLTLNVLQLLTMPARKGIAGARLDAEILSVASAVVETATQTRLVFLELQAAEHLAAVMREIAVAAEASYEFAGRVHDAGNLSDLALANEQALYEQARLEYARALAEAADQREHLNVQLGLWGEQTAWSIVDRLADLPAAEPDLSELETLAVRQRLDLAAAALEVQAIARAAGLQRDWRFLLTTEVGFNAGRDTDGQWVLGPEVSLELPIFNQRQGEIMRLDAALLGAEARLEGLAIETRSDVRRLRDRLYAARFEAQHYRDTLVPLRVKITSLTQQQYNFMLVDTFDLLAAKREEYTAYRDYLSSVHDYWAIHAELEGAVGGRLPTAATELLPMTEPTTEPMTEPMPMPAHEHGDH